MAGQSNGGVPMRARSVDTSGTPGPVRRLGRRQVAALSLTGLLLLLGAAAALAATGDLTQPAGTAGCISETGSTFSGPCADGHALRGASAGPVGPRGEGAHVPPQPAPLRDAVARLTPTPQTGALTEPAGAAGCISDSGSGPCANGHALDGANSVAVSSDGKSV